LDQQYNFYATFRGGNTDFHDIRYHISYPNADPLNQQNANDPAARALFFGVTQPPFTVMDGKLNAKFGNTYAITKVEIDRRALTKPKFDLALTAALGSANNKINFSMVITADSAFNSPLIAQVALVENSTGGFNNVLRKQLLGPDGETINVNWPAPAPPLPSQSLTITKTDVEINVPITNPSQLTLIAYVQDRNTKEIYQSVVIAGPAVQGGPITAITEPVHPAVSSVEEIQMYPNPANGSFKFELPDNMPAGFTWKIADQRGITVLSGDFEGAVNRQKAVEVNGIANGIYFVIIGAPDQPTVYRKLAVMNGN
jgi:Secretion system C-terminal sorting domain